MKLIEYLPNYYKDILEVEKIMDIGEKEITDINKTLQDVSKQLYVDTADWGLSLWEKDLGLTYNSEMELEERRSRIKSKLRGTGKVDAALIKAVAEAYNNGEVDVLFNSDVGNIIIKFIARDGIPQNLTDLKKAVGDIKPAHLGIIYDFMYLIWSNLDARNITWDELDAKNLTWDEFETGVW